MVNFEFQPNATESNYSNFVNSETVYGMFDAALCALRGDNDPRQAMRRLVPYQPGERVFIKLQE